MDYIVTGPHEIPRKYVSKGIQHLDLSKEALKEFWQRARESTDLPIDNACGCYVYAIKAGRGITPWYVGQAKKSFGLEVFSLDKYKKYKEHYEGIRKGTPIILLVVRQTPKGRVEGIKLGAIEANWVEDYLIRRAVDKNPHLLNKQQTAHFTNVRIPGVHNANAKTKSDKDLAAALSIRKPFGFTKPIGKFHQKRAQ